MMKKSICISLIFILLLLCACGNTNPKTEPAVESAASDSAEQTAEPVGKISLGSDNMITVPDIVGKSVSDAKNILVDLGLRVDIKYERSGKEKDVVVLSEPLPGNRVSSGTKIVLTVSAGRGEEQMTVDLDFTSLGEVEKDVKVYVDGELDLSKHVTLGASVSHKVFTFVGKKKMTVKFKVNNEFFAEYVLDFENMKILKNDN